MFAPQLLERIFHPLGDLLADEGHANFNPIAAAFNAAGLHLVPRKEFDRLYYMATRDNLTRLLNRNGFDLEFPALAKRALENDSDISFMLFDIDLFKLINDGPKGHPGGDDILKRMAAITAEAINVVGTSIRKDNRGADMAMRFGGEEILVVILGPQIFAEAVAVRICRTVEDKLSDETGRVTMSAGIASFKASEISAEQLIGGSMLDIPALKKAFQEADERLYMAKHNGRNCVCSDNNGHRKIVYSGQPRSLEASRHG